MTSPKYDCTNITVLNTANWTANFEEATAPDAGHVAMDTSPWDGSAKEPPEKWAEFTNKVPDEETKENWADFSNFSSISR